MDPFTLFIVNLLIGIALSAASSLVAQMFATDQGKAPAPGVRGSIQTGGDVPMGFVLGFYATAGYLEYAGTWGNSGETPNAYYTKVITVSDLPIRSFTGLYVNGERVTIGGSATGDLGFPISEYTVGGVEHLWVKFYTGAQTTADPLLVSAFGSDPDRPWLTDMIGRGLGYAVVTALVNRELFAGLPEYLFEVEGVELDDPRGDDEQENPIVAVDNVFRGFYYDGDWIWGPQGIGDHNLPSANWQAQMDKCDVAVSLAAGGTEKRFRFGLEVSVDQEPHAVINELLKACEGRIAEIGGVYKVLVGEPGSSAKSITDEDIVITAGQSYDPFPGLEETYNGITATYPEPLEAWESKEAPPRYDSALETADGSRRLPFSTSYKAVPYPNQVQRLMRAAVQETRRFRRHSFTGPGEWWEYDPLDVFDWTSARNSYTSKLFLVVAMDDLPNGNQIVASQETDPADYEWISDYELPWDVAPLVTARPAPQITTGFAAAPYVVVDDAGADRRAAIEVSWDGGLRDVRAIKIEVRESWDTKDVIAVVTVDYDITDASPSVVIANQAILPNKLYEVRGLYLPFGGRVTRWSNQDAAGVDGPWLEVTTPNVRFSDLDVDLSALGESVLGWTGAVRSLIEQFRLLGTLLEEADRENYDQRETLSREIRLQMDGLEASFTEVIEVALGPGGAIALALESLYAAMGGNSSEVNVRWEAVAAPTGYSARYAVQAAVNDGTFRSATFFLDVPADTGQPTRIGFMAGQTVFFTSGGDPIALMDEDGHFKSANGAVDIDMLTGAASFTSV